ncbi:MAG: hypothetical protein K6E74_00705 [Bacilli bacterium]|nr:hypothetical protein [Bacilli bacterium]
MANKIEKQKRVLLGFGILVLVLALGAIVGGIVLLATMANKEGAALALHIAFGILLILGSLFLIVVGVRIVWIGGALKATHGSISEENLAKEKSPTTKVCPKCGCTNTVDATECTNCHTAL